MIVPLLVADRFTEVVAQVSTAGAVTVSVGFSILKDHLWLFKTRKLSFYHCILEISN